MENNNNITQDPKTATYAAVIKVDVEELRTVRLQEGGINASDEELDDAVCAELGLAASSGVNTDSLELMEDIEEKTPYLVEVICAYDGFEFKEKSVLLVDKGVDPNQAAEVFAKHFEPNTEPQLNRETRVYSFLSGKDVWVGEVEQISELEYHILKKYL